MVLWFVSGGGGGSGGGVVVRPSALGQEDQGSNPRQSSESRGEEESRLLEAAKEMVETGYPP